MHRRLDTKDGPLSRVSDDELLRRVRERRDPGAEHELLRRYYPRVCGIIAWLARQARLPAAEVEDAQQEAVFALRRAIDTYDPRRREGRPCRFPSFLTLAIRCSFLKYLQRLRALESRYDRSATAADLLQGDALRLRSGDRRILERFESPNDPATLVQVQEVIESVWAVLGSLDPGKRRLAESLLSSEPLRMLAAAEGISYDRAKRLLQQLVVNLRAALHRFID